MVINIIVFRMVVYFFIWKISYIFSWFVVIRRFCGLLWFQSLWWRRYSCSSPYRGNSFASIIFKGSDTCSVHKCSFDIWIQVITRRFVVHSVVIHSPVNELSRDCFVKATRPKVQGSVLFGRNVQGRFSIVQSRTKQRNWSSKFPKSIQLFFT